MFEGAGCSSLLVVLFVMFTYIKVQNKVEARRCPPNWFSSRLLALSGAATKNSMMGGGQSKISTELYSSIQ